MVQNYYKTLGVSKDAKIDDIKKAYRKLALQYHPDRGGDKETETKFKEVNAAYQVLSDPQKRQAYDQFGEAAFQNGGRGTGGFGGGNPFGQGFEGDFSGFSGGFGTEGSPFGGGGLGDIFEEFFGSSMSQVQAQVNITPAQAVLGEKIHLQVGNETVEFEIPAGVQSGTSFRFSGKGQAMRNGKKGDLILTINIEFPRHVTKEQKELWEKLRESEQTKKGWWN